MDREQPSSVGDPGRFRHLVSHIHDAVVEFEITDGRPRVLDVNESFVEVFGYERERIVGESLNEFIVPNWLSDEAEGFDERTAVGEINYGRVQRETTDGLREFLYRGIPYETTNETTLGFAVYTDITGIRRQERRLQVLNRVLRHNLRNELTVVRGLLAGIDDEFEEKQPVLERDWALLDDSVRSLERLAEEAAEINRVLRASGSQTSVDCIPLLHSAVERFRGVYPNAKIETRLPESQPVVGTDRYRAAFDALVENAIEHNPAGRPHVWITVTPVQNEDWIDVVVADDGPRIPETERSVITGESEIDQTNHGSGLGLWLVKWTVESVGGGLFFEQSDAGGNCVRLRLRTPTANGLHTADNQA